MTDYLRMETLTNRRLIDNVAGMAKGLRLIDDELSVPVGDHGTPPVKFPPTRAIPHACRRV